MEPRTGGNHVASRARILFAAGISSSLLAGLAVAGSTWATGATTTENTVADASVAAAEGAAAETSVAPAGTGSSERLAQRPVGTTDAPLGYYEYLAADYDDDGSSPLLVFLHGFGESGDGSTNGLEILLATGIPQLIASDMWPAERPLSCWPRSMPTHKRSRTSPRVTVSNTVVPPR